MIRKLFHRLYHPEVFQGGLHRNNYFEGWYFKLVSENGRKALAVIPGVSLTKKKIAFIQVIDGMTGHTDYFEYPVKEFHFNRRQFEITIGDSVFSLDKMVLNIKKKMKISGEVRFQDIDPYPVRTFSPGIMGPYGLVPNMECYHAVVSVNHGLEGKIRVNGKGYDFSGGRGYIEKDWGRSFPSDWIWLQCNHFDDPGTSVMVSIANIPWGQRSFVGLAAFIKHGGKLYPFATYTKAEVKKAGIHKNHVHLLIRGRDASLEVRALLGKAGLLKAPVDGKMERRIKESVNSEVDVTLYDSRNMVIFQGTGKTAGLEVVGNILELIRAQGK